MGEEGCRGSGARPELHREPPHSGKDRQAPRGWHRSGANHWTRQARTGVRTHCEETPGALGIRFVTRLAPGRSGSGGQEFGWTRKQVCPPSGLTPPLSFWSLPSHKSIFQFLGFPCPQGLSSSCPFLGSASPSLCSQQQRAAGSLPCFLLTREQLRSPQPSSALTASGTLPPGAQCADTCLKELSEAPVRGNTLKTGKVCV